MHSHAALSRGLRVALAACALVALSFASMPRVRAQDGARSLTPVPNYDLAAQWTSQKVSKLVFDTTVAPRWLETSDRFWYAYQTRDGRRFSLVDPLKKTRAPLFDHAKMAATLTAITRMPYDAQHLPFTSVRFVKKDAAFEFEVSVPRDADVVTAPKKITTTEQAAKGGDEILDDEDDMAGDPQQQGGRGRAGGPAAAPRNKTLHFEYDMATGKVTLLEDYKEEPRQPRWASLSPDGKTIVFARSHNLFMMDADNYAKALKKADDPSIVEVQLTKDGVEYYSFARTTGAAELEQEQQQQQQQQQQQGETQQADTQGNSQDKNARAPAIQAIWSRDSSRFATIRRDQRKVKDLWVINALANPRPTLETYRYAMPGEENVTLAEIHVFDVAAKSGLRVKADRFADQSLSIATKPQRPGAGGGRGGGGVGAGPNQRPTPAEWLSDSPDKLYLTRLSRDMHKLDVCIADAKTGEVKPIVEERLNTYIETKPLRLVNSGSELIFWSERDGWGHFYLYDANTGALKNRITDGEFVTTALENVDEKARVAYISAGGREKGEDPYYTHLYRVGLDGSGLKLLNPGNATHAVAVNESARYFVDNASRVDGSPESALYDTLGNVVTKLETPDLSALMEVGFKYPEPFMVKADDGVTDLYGVMYKPFDFDPQKKYPIIAYVYPGPQTESVTKNFNPRSTSIALAQYGFIVIEVGNRGGNPQRSKWYHNYGYGNLRDYGLADKKTAIEQLARRYPYVDINKVGIWGHSGGGFMSAAAMLVYPDFFKVAWSESGNHENNIYNNTWSEKHHGIKEIEKDGKTTFEYAIDKNSELAKNLKGHLMLVTGDIDNNVHPANTYRLADALIKANKRFDFFIIPGKRHGYADAASYVNVLRGDYFCRHLLGRADESVDITELNRETEQNGKRQTGTTTVGRGGQ
ncbi:MAG: peptidase S9 [Acidobacteria bacterium RIFCSPLOWO2_02_FULL_67_36]|nr:MAG: peptidase S9 [Acidobacteria bacterium RIFCSPLOWO2_02_FULL_67_36]OFW19002.1 MAG: peptidase S9 [Acidobacteria bacterium RIFCSPLOWO2_12_FULL_66_21]